MKPALTKQAHKELTEILRKQFSGTSVGYPAELVEEFGLILLGLTALTLKRRIRINKQKDAI